MEELRQNYQLLFENISELMSQRYKMLGILGLYIEDLEQETPIDAVLYYVFKNYVYNCFSPYIEITDEVLDNFYDYFNDTIHPNGKKFSLEDLDEAIINGLNGNTTLYIAKISPN